MGRPQPSVQEPGGRRPASDLWERRAVPLALALLAVLALQGLIFIGESSQTSDEAAHLAAGYSYLKAGDFRLNPEHPPLLKEIAALPLLPLGLSFPWGPLWEQAEEWNIGRLFVHENRLTNDTILLLGRLPMLALSIGLGWFLFAWARTLLGARGALLALSLYAFDPNVVAHSCLVTTDLGVTLFMYLAVYSLWAWSETPSPLRLALCGLAVGGAFASKFTSLWLLPILGMLAAALWLLRVGVPARPWRRGGGETEAAPLARIAGLALAGLGVALVGFLVVALSYAGSGLGAYLVGLERGLIHSGIGHMAYLNGQYSEDGWWYYFLYAYAVKTPIGTLAIVAAALVALARGARLRLKDELFLWIPILTIVAITCVWRVNIGLRHLLPIYPFLYIAAGRLVIERPAPPQAAAAPRRRWRAAAKGLAAACVAWNLVEAGAITPYQLAYFNELAGGPRNGHLHLLDSNLDWGQSSKALRRFMTAENLPVIYCAYSGNSDPAYYGVSYQYTPGSGNLDASKHRPTRVPDNLPREVLVLSAMVLHSVHFTDVDPSGAVATHDLYAPLRAMKPIAQPGYSLLAYDITRDPGAHAYLASLDLSFGLSDLADYEARKALRLDPRNAVAQAVLQKIQEQTVPQAGPESGAASERPGPGGAGAPGGRAPSRP